MSINKNGVITEQCFSTSLLSQYDTNFYIEPDDSIWIRIAHHNNPTNVGLFSSTVLSDADIKELYNSPVSITSNGTLITQGEIKEE